MVIDFHIHSKYSFDCFLEPAKIIELARQNGLDGLAITDHDTMAGVDEFRSLAPDLYIITGQEISTKDGDILGLFLKTEIKNCEVAQEAIAEIRAQGGLAVLAHPFKWPFLMRSPELLKNFDCIEVFNARNNIPSPFLENFLAKRAVSGLKLACIAGSDTHEGFELGNAYTIFDFSSAQADDEAIKKAILSKQVRIVGQEVSLALEIVSHFSRCFKSWRNK
jgi:predicted metal-dependent phosphoesterase TrpH